jgi:hypothetical protein
MSVGSNSSQPSPGGRAGPASETGPAADTASQPACHSTEPELVRSPAEIPAADLTASATDGTANAPVRDGRAALAVDLKSLPDIDATLDMLFGSRPLPNTPVPDPKKTPLT